MRTTSKKYPKWSTLDRAIHDWKSFKYSPSNPDIKLSVMKFCKRNAICTRCQTRRVTKYSHCNRCLAYKRLDKARKLEE